MMQNELSSATQRYLSRYYCILDDMIKGMNGAQLTDSISRNFIVQMIPHHEAAIEMSRNLLQFTTLIPLQNIAENIITEQTQSIADMEDVLDRCTACKSTRHETEHYLNNNHRITQTMFNRMRKAKVSNSINSNFMREMIPHHEGAIQMSRNALQFPICRELKPILNAIIVSQTKGVREMQALLRRTCQ